MRCDLCLLIALALAFACQVGAELPILVPGSTCPTSGVIPYQYIITIAAGPNGAQPLLASNLTLAPFSAKPVPIEELFVKQRTPLIESVCDSRKRCIQAYEMIAAITTLDLGFTSPKNNRTILSQLLTYDGTFPGPGFRVMQGQQVLVRLHNHIFCNTSDFTPLNSTGHFYEAVSGLTLHLHGAASLSPFDGWTIDNIQACQWKDYVFPNDGFLDALWYHDHAMGITAQSVGSGLVGTYQVLPCDMNIVPEPLRRIGPAEYLVISDGLFIQDEGSDFMNPSLLQQKVLRDVQLGNATYPVAGLSGDHIFVNGKPWPVVKVQRRPYWFILHAATVARPFLIELMDTSKNVTLNSMTGRFYAVGSDAGLRDEPSTASGGLLISSGERYQVVVDFTSFSVGTEIVMTNRQIPQTAYPAFCYTSLVMKFIVDGTEPPREPFNPLYFINPYTQGGGQNDIGVDTIAAACSRAMSGKADVVMQTNKMVVNGSGVKMFTSMNGADEEWRTAMVGDPSSLEFRRKLMDQEKAAAREQPEAAQKLDRPGHDAQGAADSEAEERRSVLMSYSMDTNSSVSQYLPHAAPTNGWSTWWIYNNVSSGGGHPIHLHLVNLFLCGRRNQQQNTTLQMYELFTPKDVFWLQSYDEIAFITRIGPHQGNYMFHCHNLQHEDDGLMGVFNSTWRKRTDASFWQGTLSTERFVGFGDVPNSPKPFQGEDPLVFSDPSNPGIGHDLYNYHSMPPSNQRTDPKHPGRPQPLTRSLLRKVLARGYYEVFYPSSRSSLKTPVKGNHYAVVCTPGPGWGPEQLM